MNATISYEDAVEKYLAAIEETRSLPSQPSQSLSTRRGKQWQLRNTHGLLATVSDDGEVSLGEDAIQCGRTDAIDAPHFHEALFDLLEIVERGDTIPDEIIIEVEDSVEAFVWRTEGLLQTARHCRRRMSESECSQFKLPTGSTYADAARQIEQAAGRTSR